MGGGQSSVTNTNSPSSDVQRQASSSGGIYTLLNLEGGGKLISLLVDHKNGKISEEVLCVKINNLICRRCGNSTKTVSDLILHREDPRMADDREQIVPDAIKHQIYKLKNEESSIYYGNEEDEERFVYYHLKDRGAVGETILHICVLNNTPEHTELAKLLLRNDMFPNLIFDFYVGRKFYGENVLHIAIADNNMDMLKFFLKRVKAIVRARPKMEKHARHLVNQRACGFFFLPADQAKARCYLPHNERYHLPKLTNYMGDAYFGEYPLAFAVSLNRPAMFEELWGCGLVEKDLSDVNGCNILHMAVIYNHVDMFKTIWEKIKEDNESKKDRQDGRGVHDLRVLLARKNRQGFTPLTLAARLAHIEIYEYILEEVREISWIFGDVSCAHFPLQGLDSICQDTGNIDAKSAMYQIVYGKQIDHLGMVNIEGVIGKLLEEKWKQFARWRFYRSFMMFFIYFLISAVAFYLRPAEDPDKKEHIGNNKNKTIQDPCYLLKGQERHGEVRMTMETLLLAGTVIYITIYARHIYYQGFTMFLNSLLRCPSKGVFVMANVVIMLMVPLRAGCQHYAEDVFAVGAMVIIPQYFLFYLSGFELTGQFVLMLNKMIQKDLRKFLCIYIVVVLGFSQGMYVLSRGVKDSVFRNPGDALIAMLVMSLGEFGDIYQAFDDAIYPWLIKTLFLLYMLLAMLLMINMLIAMMGDTFVRVSDNWKNGELLKEKANIILVMEQSVSPRQRREEQEKYTVRYTFENKHLHSPHYTVKGSSHGGRGAEERAYIFRWHKKYQQDRQEEINHQKQMKVLQATMDREQAKL